MNPLYGLIVAGIVLCMAAVLVWGGRSADGSHLSMPEYAQAPLAVFLAALGIYCILIGFKKSWQQRDVAAFIMGGIVVLFLIGSAFQ